jgi:hypothetical protein
MGTGNIHMQRSLTGEITAVILATQEAEIKKMEVQNQPHANSSGDPISKKTTIKKEGGVWRSGSRCRP